MKFVFNTPERLGQKLQSFPEFFRKVFFSTRKLFDAFISDNSEAIAAYGVANLSDYLLIYVDE